MNETRKLYAITLLKEVKQTLGFSIYGECYNLHIYNGLMHDTKKEAIKIIQDGGLIYAIIQEVYMTFSKEEWIKYDNKKKNDN